MSEGAGFVRVFYGYTVLTAANMSKKSTKIVILVLKRGRI